MATVFSVRASAGKGRFSVALVSENPVCIKVEVPQEAQGGKANSALVFGFEKLLGCPVFILSGKKSRKKVVAAECEMKHLIEKVREFEKKG